MYWLYVYTFWITFYTFLIYFYRKKWSNRTRGKEGDKAAAKQKGTPLIVIMSIQIVLTPNITAESWNHLIISFYLFIYFPSPAQSATNSRWASREKDFNPLQRLCGGGKSSGLRQESRQALDSSLGCRQGIYADNSSHAMTHKNHTQMTLTKQQITFTI